MKKILSFALIFALATTSAFASKKKRPEVYPATEEGPSEEVVSSAPGYHGEAETAEVSADEETEASVPAPAPVPARLSAPAPKRPAPKKKKATVKKVTAKYEAQEKSPAPLVVGGQPTIVAVQSPNATEQTKDPSGYDTVPGSQTEPLLRRLRLAEELVARFGRAYDYRAYTVTQLQSILGQLQAAATQATEVRHRETSRTEIKKTVATTPTAKAAEADSDIPAPESTNSIGSEAPESPAGMDTGGGIGAETIAPNQ